MVVVWVGCCCDLLLLLLSLLLGLSLLFVSFFCFLFFVFGFLFLGLTGSDPCVGVYKQLAIEIDCGASQCGIVTENWPKETNGVTVGCDKGKAIAQVVDAQFVSDHVRP